MALQIKEGAPADVYAAASLEYPLELYEAGLVHHPITFAVNELVLIVPRANPAGIASIEDLDDPGIHLVIGARGVPVGDYARAALTKLGAAGALRRVVSEEEDTKGVLSKVALGEADAGFVYSTDVVSVAGQVTAIGLPKEAQPSIEYAIAMGAGTSADPAAQAFQRAVLGARGQRLLAEAGFGLP